MKQIIYIPDDYYKFLKRIKISHYTAKAYSIIQNGIPIPDKDTNGDWFQRLVPVEDVWTCYNFRLDQKQVAVRTAVSDTVICFNADWWNAPCNWGNICVKEQKSE